MGRKVNVKTFIILLQPIYKKVVPRALTLDLTILYLYDLPKL